MKKFNKLTAVAAPLPLINVDTDMIIPARFLKTIKRTGLGQSLFHTLRFDENGGERKDFVLNKSAYKDAKILIAGANFGCGSSREHAPWALDDFGIRCVIAPDFADIFFNNSFKNGILLIKLSQKEVDDLMEVAERGANSTMTINLENQEIISSDGKSLKFELDPFKQHCLINGLDDIGLTMEKEKKIAAFEETQKVTQPWL